MTGKDTSRYEQLVHHLQQQNADTVNYADDKYAFCSLVFIGVQEQGEQGNVAYHAPGTKESDQGVLPGKHIQEFREFIVGEPDEVEYGKYNKRY
jgi:hypothetical protein